MSCSYTPSVTILLFFIRPHKETTDAPVLTEEKKSSDLVVQEQPKIDTEANSTTAPSVILKQITDGVIVLQDWLAQTKSQLAGASVLEIENQKLRQQVTELQLAQEAEVRKLQEAIEAQDVLKEKLDEKDKGLAELTQDFNRLKEDKLSLEQELDNGTTRETPSYNV